VVVSSFKGDRLPGLREKTVGTKLLRIAKRTFCIFLEYVGSIFVLLGCQFIGLLIIFTLVFIALFFVLDVKPLF
jgi:hypothetical protein